MKITISNEIIREFHPCYDPSKFITDENEELTVIEWIEKYRDVVPAKDIFWLLLRREFLSEKYLKLFAVRCAREALKLIENPDERSVEACNVAERYINGEATKEELLTARDAAYDAIDISVYTVTNVAVNISASTATSYAAHDAANAAYIAADVAVDDKLDIAYSVVHSTCYAAFYVAYASYAITNAAYMTASSDSEAADAAYNASNDVANAACSAQLEQLLTYFKKIA
jgi:hypothetical protein